VVEGSPELVFLNHLPDLIRVDLSSLLDVDGSTYFVDAHVATWVMCESGLVLLENESLQKGDYIILK
jgi:hypothetical protein